MHNVNVCDRMLVCRRGQYACAFVCVRVGGVNIFVCVCVHGPVQPVGMATQPKTGEMGSGVSGDTDPVKCVQD